MNLTAAMIYFIGFTTNQLYIKCTVNEGLTVSEKSVSQTSFNGGRFQENLLSFQNISGYTRLFDVICLQIHHSGVAFLLSGRDEKCSYWALDIIYFLA